jgi:ABC-2 type transport system ATP-binding protein
VLTVSDLSAERTVAILTSSGIAFSEVSAHRASLEEAYMELTRDAVEFRAAAPPGPAGGAVPADGAVPSSGAVPSGGAK